MNSGFLRGSALICALTLALAACGGSDKKVQYDDEGKERISILTSTSDLKADDGLKSQSVLLPKPYRNGSWTQAGGNASHAVQHLSLADEISPVWAARIGNGNKNYERMITGPVSAQGRVYAMDVKGRVTAVDLETGRVQWETLLGSRGDKSKVGYGGGVAYYKGVVFATSGHGYVVALDAGLGRELWRYDASVPFRGSPTVSGDRVFAVTHDNQMIALDARTGEYVWDQVGIAESAGMLGAASPAFDGTALVAALSSGELIALLGSNGQILWQDTLASSTRLTPLAALADIDGNPVIDRGRVYAVSHSGSLVSIDMRTGERSWEADIAGVNTPWIAGNYAFVTTIDSQLACISLIDGRTRWVTQLQRFKKQDKRTGLIKWNGPILAGDRLIITSSHGYVLSASPYTGEILSGEKLRSGTSLPHIVVDETLIIQTDNGELIAYR